MKLIDILFVVVIVILGFYFYSKIRQKKIEAHNKPFEERLEEILELTETKYKLTYRKFAINFMDTIDKYVVFQIVDRTLFENSEGNRFGYCIHLIFNNQFSSDPTGDLERFLNSDLKEKFHYNIWEGIPEYQLDLKTDTEQIVELSKKILKEIYKKELSEIKIEEFEVRM